MSRGSTAKFGELESKSEGLPMEWVTKYEFYLAKYLLQRLGSYKSEDK